MAADETIISELTPATSINDSDVMVIEDSVNTKKVTAEKLAEYVNSKYTITPSDIPEEVLDEKVDVQTLCSTDNIEDTSVAQKPHTEGDYFITNGGFVKALDDIAVGDTLSEGENIESTNIAEELASIHRENKSIHSENESIKELIPSNASVSNKLATSNNISDITAKIPSNASSSNKLATMLDVNNSSKGMIQIGEFNSTDYDTKKDFINAIYNAMHNHRSGTSDIKTFSIWLRSYYLFNATQTVFLHMKQANNLYCFESIQVGYDQTLGNQGYRRDEYYFMCKGGESQWGINGLLGIETSFGTEYDSPDAPVETSVITKQFDIMDTEPCTVFLFAIDSDEVME